MKTQSKKILAVGIQEAYEGLFNLRRYAQLDDEQKILVANLKISIDEIDIALLDKLLV